MDAWYQTDLPQHAESWHVRDLVRTRKRCDRMLEIRIPTDNYNQHGELLCNFKGCTEPANKSPSYRGMCREHRKMRTEHKRRRGVNGGLPGRKLGPRCAM
jgi:hypothetical protein